MTGHRPRRVYVVLTILLLLLLPGLLSACGGSSTPPTGNGTFVPTPGGFAFGIDWNNAGTMSNHMEQSFQAIAATGATWTRPPIPWQKEEPSQGQFNWSLLDNFIQLAQKYHIQLIVQMGPTPAWDDPGGGADKGRTPPADCQNGGTCQSAYDYVKAFAAEVSHQNGWDVIKYIIPRNEPYDAVQNWAGGTADEYATFLNAVYRAAHDSGTSLKVMPGGIEKYPVTDHGGAGHQFIDALFANPLFCKSLDVLDVHLGYWGPQHSSKVIDQTEQAIQSCNGGKAVPIWVTEVALESDQMVQGNSNHTAILGSSFTNGTGAQAQFLTNTYNDVLQNKNVIGINWTALVDAPAGSGKKSALSLGLMDAQFQPKASYGALTTYIKQHKGS